MIYANTEEIYNELYTQLQAIASLKQIEYFDKNWHPIKSKWVAYYRKNIVTLGITLIFYFFYYQHY